MERDDIARDPELMPPPPPPPPAPPTRRSRLIGRRTATAAVAGGLMAGGLAGGYIISQAASTPTPSASAPSGGSSTAPGADTGRRPGGGNAASRTEDLSQVAGAIGITTAQLQTELAAGKTIAAVATAHNVTPATVISTMVTAENKEIDAAASAGKITAAQATAEKANTTKRVTDFVNGVRPAGGPGGHGGPGAARGEDQTVIAGAIGITVQMLQTELSGGKTIAAVATAHSVTPATVISALAASENKEIDAALAAGKITAAQATSAKAATTQRATDVVNGVHPARGHGAPPASGTAPTN
jgi:transposase-like protein